jgi:hypothetical protein
MPEKKDGYKKYLAYLKDIVYIAGIVIALAGWVTTKSKNEAILESTVKNNTKTLEKVEEFMKSQSELNGKFIQYMVMDSQN